MSFHCLLEEPKSNELSVFGIMLELTSAENTMLSSSAEPSVILPLEPALNVISPTAFISPPTYKSFDILTAGAVISNFTSASIPNSPSACC